MYKFRKIIMLVLCLALVCAMSVTAFAASTYTDRKEYDGGAAWVEVHAEISRYGTWGFTEGDSFIDQASTGIRVEYSYIDNNLDTKFKVESANQLAMTYISISLEEDKVHSMYRAYYDFWAQVLTNAGTEDYENNSVMIEF